MAQCVIIVQGEGRGHMSQSMALSEYLTAAGHHVLMTYVGNGRDTCCPFYFTEFFGERLKRFNSPYFLRTPNEKGIYLGRTILFNLLRAVLYLKEVLRLRDEINRLNPDLVFNFYDIIGALALKKLNSGIRRIGIGHHFFLHLDGYRCQGGSLAERWLLKKHTTLVMNSCDRVLALSFREIKGDSVLEVIPPLIREKFRNLKYQPGNRYLVYLLHGGFLYDLIGLAESDPDFEADVFTTLAPVVDLPAAIEVHPLNDEKFSEKMAHCKGLITTAGFDTVAEAAYLGIQTLVVPSRHHFEQRCNGADIERNGIGCVVERIVPGVQHEMKNSQNHEYREWVDHSWDIVLKYLQE